MSTNHEGARILALRPHPDADLLALGSALETIMGRFYVATLRGDDTATESALEDAERVQRSMLASTATTLAGIKAQALAAKFGARQHWEVAPDRLDWESWNARTFIDAILSAEGARQ